MREFASAVQPYAHYSSPLLQWQYRLHHLPLPSDEDGNEELHTLVELTPRAYDAQEATRITLFHALVSYILGRIVAASRPDDTEFIRLMERFGSALGKSRYLDGHATNWSQQFWATVWDRNGGTILE